MRKFIELHDDRDRSKYLINVEHIIEIREGYSSAIVYVDGMNPLTTRETYRAVKDEIDGTQNET